MRKLHPVMVKRRYFFRGIKLLTGAAPHWTKPIIGHSCA